jgi:tetratricopeptide (TPR) repeat protein
VRWSLLLVPVLVIAGAVAVVVLRRQAAAPAPAPAPLAVASASFDAGLTDDELFAASMARLAEAKRRAEEEAAARAGADSRRQVADVAPDAGGLRAVLDSAGDAGIAPTARAELERAPRCSSTTTWPGRWSRSMRSTARTRRPRRPRSSWSPSPRRPGPGRRAGQARAGAPRMQELPTSESAVRSAVARVLATVALASAKAGQPERSRLQARAALALDEAIPEAYLALGEYQFQDNDLSGAIDTWERGLRVTPGDLALARRLERGRAESQRLGGLERVSSEHFVVAFDGRADVPAARASLEVMEAAYRGVGALFQLYPEGPISLVVYPDRSFEREGHASWSAAFYDGKIRLPAAGADVHWSRSGEPSSTSTPTRSSTAPPAARRRPPGSTRARRRRAAPGDPGPPVRCTPDVHRYPPEPSKAASGDPRLAQRLARLPEARHAVERIAERHGEAGSGGARRGVHRRTVPGGVRARPGPGVRHLRRGVRRRGAPLIAGRHGARAEGETGFVSGSTAGIGWAIAAGLAAEGAEVVLNGRTEARVQTAVSWVRARHPGARVRGIAADSGTAEGCARVVRELPEVDVLVNNPASSPRCPSRTSPTPNGCASSR